MYGLRPVPFYPGIVFAVLGLIFSIFIVKETSGHAHIEARRSPGQAGVPLDSAGFRSDNQPGFANILLLASWKDRALFAVSQAGMVNNLNDGMLWGLIPIYLAGAGLPLEQVGVVAAVYPGVWGVSQLVTGAILLLSDTPMKDT